MAPHGERLANGSLVTDQDRFEESQRPQNTFALRIQQVTRGRWDTFADSQRPTGCRGQAKHARFEPRAAPTPTWATSLSLGYAGGVHSGLDVAEAILSGAHDAMLA